MASTFELIEEYRRWLIRNAEVMDKTTVADFLISSIEDAPGEPLTAEAVAGQYLHDWGLNKAREKFAADYGVKGEWVDEVDALLRDARRNP